MNKNNDVILEPSIKETWRELCLVGFIAIVLVFPYLGRRDLWTAGEARVAQVAVQMVRSGDWIVPHLGDDLRIAKPPLAYWLVCLTDPFNSTGINEFKSRIPNAVSAVLAALLIAYWARKTISGYGGIISGVGFVSTSACWWQARNSTIEMTLLFFTVAALFCWWVYNESQKSRWLYLTYFSLALAALDKGPVTPPLVLLIIVVYLLSLKENPFKLDLKAHLKGIALFLAVTLPWAIAITFKVGRNDEGQFVTINEWFYQSAGRFEGFDHIKEFWYFLPKILGDGQPWVFFAIIGLIAFFTLGKTAADKKGLRFFVIWAIVSFVFFSIPASKKSYYILPIYPALVVIAAWVFSNLISRNFSGNKVERACGALCEVVGTLLVLTGLTLPFMSDYLFNKFEKLSKYSDHISQLMIAAALAVFLGIIMAYCATTRRWKIVAMSCFLAVSFSFAIHVSLTDDLNAYKGDREFCEAISDRIKPDDEIYTYAMGGQPVYRYYMDRHVERLINPQYLIYAIRDLKKGHRILLGLDERDWFKFNNYYLLSYETDKVVHSDVEAVILGLKTRYPEDVEIFVSTTKNNKSLVLIQMGLNVPKKRATDQDWEEWKSKRDAMQPEIYETVSRLNSMQVSARKLTVVFNEFSPLLDTGRLWVQYTAGEDEVEKFKVPEKIPYPEEEKNDDEIPDIKDYEVPENHIAPESNTKIIS